MRALLPLLAVLVVGAKAAEAPAPPAADAEIDARDYLCEKAWRIGWRSGPDGWVYRGQHFRTDYSLVPEAEAGLTRLLRALEDQGMVMVATPIPPRPTVMYPSMHPPPEGHQPFDGPLARKAYRDLLDWFRERDVPVVNLLAVASRDDLPEPYFLPRDAHWTHTGSRVSAEAVGRVIRNHPKASVLPPGEFERLDMEPHEMNGGFSKKLAIHCGTELPLTVFARQRTRPVPNQSLGLLDEVPPPEIVLLGTSFSTTWHYNFSGYIEEALSTDVLPAQVSAGGTVVSLWSYLHSDEFHTRKPTFLVWEFPAYLIPREVEPDTLQDATVYRELVPAVHGRCSDEAAVLDQVGDLAGGTLPLWGGLNKRALVAEGHYLALELGDPAIVDFRVQVTTHDGTTTDLPLSVPHRAKSSGRFFLDLSEAGGAVKDVSLVLPDEVSGSWAARVCPFPG